MRELTYQNTKVGDIGIKVTPNGTSIRAKPLKDISKKYVDLLQFVLEDYYENTRIFIKRTGELDLWLHKNAKYGFVINLIAKSYHYGASANNGGERT